MFVRLLRLGPKVEAKAVSKVRGYFSPTSPHTRSLEVPYWAAEKR